MNFWSERFTEGFLCFSFEQKLNFLCLFGDVVPWQHIFARTVVYTKLMCVVFTFHKSTVGHIMVKMCNLAMLLYFENIEIVIIDVV